MFDKNNLNCVHLNIYEFIVIYDLLHNSARHLATKTTVSMYLNIPF